MARLIIQQKRGKFSVRMPHKILINGQFIGIMKSEQIVVELPYGDYDVSIQSMIPYFSSSLRVPVSPRHESVLRFSDREQWWDALFVLDIILWLIKRFLHLAAPWTWIYEIFTNGYFVLWIIYEWLIRHNYFKLELDNVR